MPEREVDEALAASLVARQLPELAGEPVRLLGIGWDNTVYSVGAAWAVRFPRRAVALPGIERERLVLGRLAALTPPLPVPVPEPVLAGEPDELFGWPFWGGPLLAGMELADAGIPDGERIALARDVGAFLAALHSPRVRDAAAYGLPVDPIRRADAAHRASLLEETWLPSLAARNIWQPDDAARELLAAAAEAGPSTAEPVLCHGDLHVRHLLVELRDGAVRAAGVIDWGDVCLADPAVDLSLAYSAFAGEARAALFDAYGVTPDVGTALRARLLALFLSAALTAYAAEQDQPALLTETLEGLRRSTAP